MDILTKDQFIKQLNTQKTADIIKHFDDIYLCTELGEHEKNIIYLAYLWKNDLIIDTGDGVMDIDERVEDADLMDYELTFEVDEPGGVNLDITHEYYQLNELINLI